MKRNAKYILTLLLLSLSVALKAQVTVEQTVDSVAMLIGEQTKLRLTVTFPKGSKLQWPRLKERQYVVPGVEIVESPAPDTLSSGGEMKVEKAYTITSFGERLYAIPALTVKVNGKPYKGGTSALKVITVDVDTLHPNQFFPPKDAQDNPFEWSEWSPYFWLSVLVLLILLGGAYLFVRLKENKPIITKVRIVRHVPPHQRALSKIETIKREHLQVSDDQKAYYTQLTDTLRQYIKERFGFNALEMTTDQIIGHLQAAGDRKMIDELRQLFQTADLVKFAKYSTQLNENDMNLVNAVNFIDETKQEGQAVEEKIVPRLSDDDKKVRSNRITIKTLLWIGGVVASLLLAYIIYNVYVLLVMYGCILNHENIENNSLL